MAQGGLGILVTDVLHQDLKAQRVLTLDEVAQWKKQTANSSVSSEAFACEGSLTILTTGTTGAPKAIVHPWRCLFEQSRRSIGASAQTWLLAFPLNHFAAIQVLLHVVLSRGTLILPAGSGIDDIVAAMATYRVDALSATPTFWRLFTGKITAELASQLALRQITLGGEAATSEILTRLRDLFPAASIAHVYATTEHGSCFSVKDGRPGFPLHYLGEEIGNVRLKIVDGELHVTPAQEADDNGHAGARATATGDLVEVVGDRVLFRGRKSEIINVGGYKVHPAKVEEIMLGVEGVLGVRVFGKSNPVTGQIVAAEMEISEVADRQVVEGTVRRECKRKLNRYEQPREFRIVEALAKLNQKIVRRT
jgi:acyl-CoA synthetase (AMP-forming)/AMP-acid ligase II